MSDNNVVELNTPKKAWDRDTVRLQAEMNIAGLIKERARLETYFDEMGSAADDDDESSDRQDDVNDAINKTIYNDTHIIALTKWGRPVLDRAGLDSLVEGLRHEEKTVVRNFVENWYNNLTKLYEWKLAGTLVSRPPLLCADVSKKLKARGVEVVYEDGGDKENGVYQIINPTCTQCVWIHPEDSTEKKRLQQVDYFQIISENDKEEDEVDANIDRRMLEYTANHKAATGPHIELVPLLLEIYGDKLEVGEEALPLMSPDGFRHWLWLMYTTMSVYEPQVIEAA